MNNTISINDECKRCNNQFHIRDLLICDNCGKILCDKCRLFLARKTSEVNHDNHYCDPDEKQNQHGKLVKLYNK